MTIHAYVVEIILAEDVGSDDMVLGEAVAGLPGAEMQIWLVDADGNEPEFTDVFLGDGLDRRERVVGGTARIAPGAFAEDDAVPMYGGGGDPWTSYPADGVWLDDDDVSEFFTGGN